MCLNGTCRSPVLNSASHQTTKVPLPHSLACPQENRRLLNQVQAVEREDGKILDGTMLLGDGVRTQTMMMVGEIPTGDRT